MDANKKKRNPLLVAAVILLLLAATLCAVVGGLWLSGRSAARQPEKAPELPQEQGEQDTGSYVTYEGKRYRYNEDMFNVLLMGIDADVDPSQAEGIREQSDLVVLAALDMKKDKLTLITIPRDLICDVQLVDDAGELIGIKRTHLNMAYTYGDGTHGSCKLVCDAVSNIFYGLPIHRYGAYFMNGIAALNDAVGGVTLVVSDDYPFWNVEGAQRLVAGETVTLTGEEAVWYTRCRWMEHPDGTALRLMRQKQYIQALIDQAMEKVVSDPASALGMYNAVSDYVITNVGLGEITYLASQVAGMEFSGQIRTVEGTSHITEDMYLEVIPDQQALYALMLDVFYTEAEDETPAP